MIDFQKELNAEQYEAVANGDGYCLVLAGAGSGKTRTITYRVAYLLEKGVKPENILLLTFTNKAAKEMIERVKNIMGGKLTEDGRDLTSLIWQGTFHAIANRYLRQYAKKIGYESNFTVLDDDDSTTLLKSCFKILHLEGSKKVPSVPMIKVIYSFSRNAQTPVEEVLQDKFENYLSALDNVREIIALYEKRKKESNVMDFDDLLVNWWQLLQDKELLQKIASQFHYVLIDEYQDTNKLQSSIVRLLSSVHNNLLVVGDDAQSIYSFRAADISNILEFPKKFPNAKVFRLETNYRSTPNILNLANNVIAQNKNQFKKELRSLLLPQVRPQVVVINSAAKEAEFIVKRISQLKEGGHKMKNVAVLFRAAFHAQPLEMLLAQSGISYEMRGGMRFFDRAHIKDTISFLRLVNNFKDEIAWWRVLEMFEGIGAETAKVIIKEVKKVDSLKIFLEQGLPMQISAKAQRGWKDFMSIANDLGRVEQTPQALIAMVAESVYYSVLRDRYENAEDRLEEIKQFGFYAKNQDNLNRFLSDITLDENYNKSKDDTRDRLVLSTIHQSKGLEWDVVFLINLSEGAFPNERALTEEGGEEEERRLFYVGITRAKNKLYLTYPVVNSRFATVRPSPFLQDIDEALVEKKMIDEYGGSVSLDNDLPTIQVGDDVPRQTKPTGDWRKRSFLMDV